MDTEFKFLELSTTAEDEAQAQRIADLLVSERLAACVQIAGPVTSVYRWRGAVEQASEWRCLAKCRASRFNDVVAAIRQTHSYEIPQLIALPIVAVSDDYAAWLDAELDA